MNGIANKRTRFKTLITSYKRGKTEHGMNVKNDDDEYDGDDDEHR